MRNVIGIPIEALSVFGVLSLHKNWKEMTPQDAKKGEDTLRKCVCFWKKNRTHGVVPARRERLRIDVYVINLLDMEEALTFTPPPGEKKNCVHTKRQILKVTDVVRQEMSFVVRPKSYDGLERICDRNGEDVGRVSYNLLRYPAEHCCAWWNGCTERSHKRASSWLQIR